jgi:hypothetical protein
VKTAPGPQRNTPEGTNGLKSPMRRLVMQLLKEVEISAFLSSFDSTQSIVRAAPQAIHRR